MEEHEGIDIMISRPELRANGFNLEANDDRYKNLRTIILTNQDEPTIDQRVAGAVDFIRKLFI